MEQRKKEFIPNESRIKYNIIDINPKIGVTSTQLYEHCLWSLQIIPASLRLTEDEKVQAAGMAAAQVWNKMEQGLVPKFPQSDFAGYALTAVRSEVFTTLNKWKYHCHRMIDQAVDYDLFSNGELGSEQPYNRLQVKEFYANIPTNCREIFDAIMAGEKYKDIRARLKMPLHVWTKKMNRLKKLYQAIF